MLKCVKCQTPYDEGQRFCKTCGTDLMSIGEQQIACPGYGVPITDQTFCHECGTHLDVTPAPEMQVPLAVLPVKPRSGFVNKIAKGSPLQILALVGGCLVLLSLILVGINWFSGGRTSSTPPDTLSQGKASGPAAKLEPAGKGTPQVLGPPYFSKPTKIAELGPANVKVAPASAGQALSLKEEMEETLFNMRKGQEEKDIDLYMACFSPSFPELEEKRRVTLTRWVVYDFSQLVFNIDDIKEEGADSHIALVTWEVQVRNRKNQKLTTSTQQFKVGFIKEQGKQLIKSLDKEGKEENK